MKNQYFGDFGDYQKFSLLRILRDKSGLKILVHWMKTKDDGSSDGKRIEYLKNPIFWNLYDKEIFNFLSKSIKQKRDLSLYEQSTHASNIRFINDYIENNLIRTSVLKSINKDIDLVFFDPDNGIEVKSTNKRNLFRYVLWSDIEYAVNLGKSVLIYQHFSRKNRDVFINEKIRELIKRFEKTVFIIKVKHSVYFLVTQEKHSTKIQNALNTYVKVWKDLVTVNKMLK